MPAVSSAVTAALFSSLHSPGYVNTTTGSTVEVGVVVVVGEVDVVGLVVGEVDVVGLVVGLEVSVLLGVVLVVAVVEVVGVVLGVVVHVLVSVVPVMVGVVVCEVVVVGEDVGVVVADEVAVVVVVGVVVTVVVSVLVGDDVAVVVGEVIRHRASNPPARCRSAAAFTNAADAWHSARDAPTTKPPYTRMKGLDAPHDTEPTTAFNDATNASEKSALPGAMCSASNPVPVASTWYPSAIPEHVAAIAFKIATWPPAMLASSGIRYPSPPMVWHANRPRCGVEVGVEVADDVGVVEGVVVVVGDVDGVLVAVVVVVAVVEGVVVGVVRWHSFSSRANVPSSIPPMAAFSAAAVASHRSALLASQLTLSHVTGWAEMLCDVHLPSAAVSTSP